MVGPEGRRTGLRTALPGDPRQIKAVEGRKNQAGGAEPSSRRPPTAIPGPCSRSNAASSGPTTGSMQNGGWGPPLAFFSPAPRAYHSRSRVLSRAMLWLCSWQTRLSVTFSTAAISFRFMSCS